VAFAFVQGIDRTNLTRAHIEGSIVPRISAIELGSQFSNPVFWVKKDTTGSLPVVAEIEILKRTVLAV
jgi:hypothetical protein